MALNDIFTMIKADKYTQDGREELIKAQQQELLVAKEDDVPETRKPAAGSGSTDAAPRVLTGDCKIRIRK